MTRKRLFTEIDSTNQTPRKILVSEVETHDFDWLITRVSLMEIK